MDDDRKNGMGIVIEYANRTVSQPDETIPIVFGKINGGQGGFNRWTINGASFDENAVPRKLRKGKRHRLVSDNRTDDAHPIHLHRNSFELTNVNGKPTSGVLKDVVLVKGFWKVEVDVTPANGRAHAFPLPSAASYGLRIQAVVQRSVNASFGPFKSTFPKQGITSVSGWIGVS